MSYLQTLHNNYTWLVTDKLTEQNKKIMQYYFFLFQQKSHAELPRIVVHIKTQNSFHEDG